MPDSIILDKIQNSLAEFEDKPLREAATDFFGAIGYQSDRKLDWNLDTFLELGKSSPQPLTIKDHQVLESEVANFNLLFQLTDSELAEASQQDLFESHTSVDTTKIFSYLFIGCELNQREYNRTDLARLTRAINKPLPMPALVLFKYGDMISLAILHRRLNKRQAQKDVLEKATLIKDIRYGDPIRGHLEIIKDFSFSQLAEDFGFHNFVSLHEAWRKRLDTFALNDKFYQEIADWYFWAKHQIDEGTLIPPRDVKTESESSLFLIRLLTRLIFCWFLLEKRLLPSALFRDRDLETLLKDFTPSIDPLKPDLSTSYYKCVLQNLFFATLNQHQEDRGFRGKAKGKGLDANRGSTNLWRFAEDFCVSKSWPELVSSVPFLNGGLFDCLDQIYQKAEKRSNIRLDDFSEEKANRLHVPNDVFFGAERPVDLSSDYGDETKKTARSKRAKVRGLINILSRYKFTIEENTPLDEEIALDPELLGKVFENLLASYNPETADTARKQTGSFYTPREVVSFMVDEALLAYLTPFVSGPEKVEQLRRLFDSSKDEYVNTFTDHETAQLITSLDSVKIFDPACGSGAFPMGALNRLVDVLGKLDPDNRLWVALQKNKVRITPDWTDSERSDAEKLWGVLAEDSRFEADYVRKLAVIEQSIFGADIQPVAVQIAKLRFFISLICDQKADFNLANAGVLPLPNLETRIVAANTLIPIDGAVTGAVTQTDLIDQRIDELREELRRVRHDHFQARDPSIKKKCREQDKQLRDQIASILNDNGLPAETSSRLAEWNPYDQNNAAPFFDPVWMFGTAYTRQATPTITFAGEFAEIVNSAQSQQELFTSSISKTAPAKDCGFEIVIGNPPYVRQEKIKDQKEFLKPHYQCYTGTADLYVYFYERAFQLLRSNGILSYITSNKWYRAAYGKPLRNFLAKQQTLLSIIDFGDAPVFTAIAYPTIIIVRKGGGTGMLKNHKFSALNWDPNTPNSEIHRFGNFVIDNSFKVGQSILTENYWRFLRPKDQSLIANISACTQPLREFLNGRLYWGVKTGLNEAFIVNRSTRDSLIADDPGSESLLKPFVRGRDVKQWNLADPELWLIFSRRGIEISDYPAIEKHLLQYKKRLEPKPPKWPTGKPWAGRKPGAYKWYEIQDNIAYYQEFGEPCVVGPSISNRPNFAPNRIGTFCNNKASIYVYDHPYALCAILNSKVIEWISEKICASKDAGYWDFEPRYSSQFPIPKISSTNTTALERLGLIVHALINDLFSLSDFPRDPLMRDFYERFLNGLVYELYFPEQLHEAGLRLFDLEGDSQLPDFDILHNSGINTKQQLRLLREKFEELDNPKHPVRASLQKLSTLESIRIIEGKG